MIKLFGQTDKTFLSNGDIVLKPLKAKVHKEDNGPYYLELETGLEYVDFLTEGNIVVANTPTGDQAFRIHNPTKTANKVSVKADHVFYDSQNYLIADSYVVDKNCNDALQHLNAATTPSSEFVVASDVQTVNSFRCVRKSLYEAIQTVIERWGGHLVRDMFNIQIKQEIGTDRGVVVRYRKNLKEISCEENWSGCVTKLLPVGKNGLLLNALDSNASLYVESEIQYEIPYVKTASFNQDDVLEEDFKDSDGNLDEEAYTQALVEDLRIKAQAFVDENCLPKVNYTLKANLDRITDIGDVVEVIDERLDVDLLTNVISFDYDCILEKYTEVEFGNFRETLSGLVSSINARADKTMTQIAQAQSEEFNKQLSATADQIMRLLQSSYVIYEGNAVYLVDTLPKESAINVIRLNSDGISYSNGGINGNYSVVLSIAGRFIMRRGDGSYVAIDKDSGLVCVDSKGNSVNGFELIPVVLYSGSGSNGSLTLSESISGFRFAEIYYRDESSGAYASERIESPDGKTFTLALTDCDSSSMKIRRTKYTASGTSVVPSGTDRGYTVLGSGVTTVTGNNYIWIEKVVGYR